jgi:5-methylcytosine-specific restriction endonuclease McrA
MKCKTCGKNAESEYCFQHKKRKPLQVVKNLIKYRNKFDKPVNNLHIFFQDIWKKRSVYNCENCGKWLGKEPLSYMFDHLLEKSKYPDLAREEDNIMIVCLECHDNKTRGFLSDLVKDKIEKVRKRFDK